MVVSNGKHLKLLKCKSSKRVIILILRLLHVGSSAFYYPPCQHLLDLPLPSGQRLRQDDLPAPPVKPPQRNRWTQLALGAQGATRSSANRREGDPGLRG